MKALRSLSLLLALGLLLPVATATAKTFPDVPSTHPHSITINAISEAGIIQGYPDGTFKPDKEINRVEFLKILIEAKGDYTPSQDPSSFDIYSRKEINFSDVEDQQWYLPYVRYATKKSIVSGYPDGSFKPAKSINLAEALKIIFTTFELPTVQFVREPDQWYEYYTGALKNDFSTRTKLSISTDIDKALTRGEVASLIDYFLGQVEDQKMTAMEDIPAATISEPVLLEHLFRPREQEHTIKGYVMYPSTCGKPKTNVIRDDSTIPEQIILEILEAEPRANMSECRFTETEHPVTFTFTAAHDAKINEMIAYGNQVEFIIHNTDKEIKHPNAPLVLYLKEPMDNGMIHTEGLIYGESSCDRVKTDVYTYDGETAITQIELTTYAEGQSCVAGLTELRFDIDIPKNTIIRGRINEQPISITFEEKSIDDYIERNRAFR